MIKSKCTSTKRINNIICPSSLLQVSQCLFHVSVSLLSSLLLLVLVVAVVAQPHRQVEAAFISISQPTSAATASTITISSSRTATNTIIATPHFYNSLFRFSNRPAPYYHHLDPFSLSTATTSTTRLYSSSSSSSSSRNDKDNNAQLPLTQQPTLYDILNSSPSASRSELKKAYVELVKQLHPDAALGSSNSSSSDLQKFQQITQAWKTLSNPLSRKRYDREQRAQKFTLEVEQALGNWANTAGPQFLRAFENVALPFLRRSAATTLAGWNAVAQDVQMYSVNRKVREEQPQPQQQQQQQKRNTTMGLGAILSNALVATQKAGKAIDRLELVEKSRDLSKRAQKEYKEAAKLREELDDIARKRVQLTLHTPKANLTSLEAMIILDGFNTVDEVTMMDTVLMRKTVTYEIERLQEMEEQVKEMTERNQEIASKIMTQSKSLEQAKVNASEALIAVESARKALQDAMDVAESAKQSIHTLENALKYYEEEQRINTLDMERYQDAMAKQQERMRLALRRKEQTLLSTESKASSSSSTTTTASTTRTTTTTSSSSSTTTTLGNKDDNLNIKGDFKEDLAEYAQKQVEKMLKRESYLRAESARLQSQAERLESRSMKLLERANELEEEEEQAYKALEEGIRVAKQAAEGGYGKYGDQKYEDFE